MHRTPHRAVHPDRAGPRRRTGRRRPRTSSTSPAPAAAGGRTVVVHPDESIQDAIDAAAPNTTIVVAGGVHAEQLTITTDGLTLVGQDTQLVPPPVADPNQCSGVAGPVSEGGPPTEAGICVIGTRRDVPPVRGRARPVDERRAPRPFGARDGIRHHRVLRPLRRRASAARASSVDGNDLTDPRTLRRAQRRVSLHPHHRQPDRRPRRSRSGTSASASTTWPSPRRRRQRHLRPGHRGLRPDDRRHDHRQPRPRQLPRHVRRPRRRRHDHPQPHVRQQRLRPAGFPSTAAAITMAGAQRHRGEPQPDRGPHGCRRPARRARHRRRRDWQPRHRHRGHRQRRHPQPDRRQHAGPRVDRDRANRIRHNVCVTSVPADLCD